MDITSLLIGIIIGAIGVFLTGFLRKAGEDLYHWIKVKINPKAKDGILPQVVVNLQSNGPDNLKNLLPSEIDHTSNVTYDDIEKAIDNVPPLQRDSIAKSYVGINVEWITYFRWASKLDGGQVYLRLSVDENYRGRSIMCRVAEKEYPELNILQEGAKIRISGKIINASSFDIELSKVRLHILNSREA